MTAQWAVRAAKDRARSSRENRVPIETLRSKSDKAAILVKLRQRIHYIFSFLWVLRRLENIVVSRAAKVASDTPYFLRALLLPFCPCQKIRILSNADFFIQAAGLAYHQPLRGWISSRQRRVSHHASACIFPAA